ncbi:hypothetical protein [Alteribacillus sp. YIM 98480]|uniref:hypothetical protein n=1 Tax=Alteribacillus sp. YIM 98480 TaxID=2606599 RepID=UPI00131E4FC7|nr:hypothetical protein [Alteribacillus sp. YIM 98480]
MWDYRVVKERTKDGTELFKIAEVFFNDNGEPWAFVEPDESFLSWESIEELEKNIDWFKEAFAKPVLYEKDDGSLETL